MSEPFPHTEGAPPAASPPWRTARWGPSKPIKILITLLLLFHCSAIMVTVLAGGGPFAMKQIGTYYYPYLHSMWLFNAYRFFAPNPGDTDVLWFRVKYQDGSAHWYQIPRREDFYLRMPFQRYMSIAMLAMMMSSWGEVPAAEDASSAASIMHHNRGTMREGLSQKGEVIFRSYARYVARHFPRNPQTGSPLADIDVYRVHYLIRTPIHVRMHWDMYDPRMLDISFVATYAPDGTVTSTQRGFIPRAQDDFFIELAQNDIVPLLEKNDQLPATQRRSVAEALQDYGIPYPLIMPILRLPTEEQRKFFDKPLDRDSLRERYMQAVKKFDVDIGKLGPGGELPVISEPAKPSGNMTNPPKVSESRQRSVQ